MHPVRAAKRRFCVQLYSVQSRHQSGFLTRTKIKIEATTTTKKTPTALYDKRTIVTQIKQVPSRRLPFLLLSICRTLANDLHCDVLGDV